MSAAKSSLSAVEKLERKLAKILPADKNIVRRAKNGDIIYETVRAVSAANLPDLPENNLPASTGQTDLSDLPNFYTETPDSPKNGQQFDTADIPPNALALESAQAEDSATNQLANTTPPEQPPTTSLAECVISIHEVNSTGQQIAAPDSEQADPLEELLSRALAKPRRGRPASFDEHNKGKLVALLSLGMSLRQAASVLGVSHGTIRNTLQADPALAEEITAARFQAQLQPLACIIREARRSWKAATWLLKYLDSKISSHEETPDERRARQDREADEFFAQARRRK